MDRVSSLKPITTELLDDSELTFDSKFSMESHPLNFSEALAIQTLFNIQDNSLQASSGISYLSRRNASQPIIHVTHCAVGIRAARASVSFIPQCQELVRAKMTCILACLALSSCGGW